MTDEETKPAEPAKPYITLRFDANGALAYEASPTIGPHNLWTAAGFLDYLARQMMDNMAMARLQQAQQAQAMVASLHDLRRPS